MRRETGDLPHAWLLWLGIRVANSGCAGVGEGVFLHSCKNCAIGNSHFHWENPCCELCQHGLLAQTQTRPEKFLVRAAPPSEKHNESRKHFQDKPRGLFPLTPCPLWPQMRQPHHQGAARDPPQQPAAQSCLQLSCEEGIGSSGLIHRASKVGSPRGSCCEANAFVGVGVPRCRFTVGQQNSDVAARFTVISNGGLTVGVLALSRVFCLFW